MTVNASISSLNIRACSVVDDKEVRNSCALSEIYAGTRDAKLSFLSNLCLGKGIAKQEQIRSFLTYVFKRRGGGKYSFFFKDILFLRNTVVFFISLFLFNEIPYILVGSWFWLNGDSEGDLNIILDPIISDARDGPLIFSAEIFDIISNIISTIQVDLIYIQLVNISKIIVDILVFKFSFKDIESLDHRKDEKVCGAS